MLKPFSACMARWASACGISTNPNFKGAKTNYDFCATKNYDCDYWRRQNPSQRRMFGENSTTRFADVTDGTSNTVLTVAGIAPNTLASDFSLFAAYEFGWSNPNGGGPGSQVKNAW